MPELRLPAEREDQRAGQSSPRKQATHAWLSQTARVTSARRTTDAVRSHRRQQQREREAHARRALQRAQRPTRTVNLSQTTADRDPFPRQQQRHRAATNRAVRFLATNLDSASVQFTQQEQYHRRQVTGERRVLKRRPGPARGPVPTCTANLVCPSPAVASSTVAQPTRAAHQPYARAQTGEHEALQALSTARVPSARRTGR